MFSAWCVSFSMAEKSRKPQVPLTVWKVRKMQAGSSASFGLFQRDELLAQLREVSLFSTSGEEDENLRASCNSASQA
jgi:hypothetical protein